jgi:3-methyladenine DNA glycosylase AlkD
VSVSELVAEIRSYLRQNADTAIAEKYRRYFVEGYDPYGVTSEQTGMKAKELYKNGLGFRDAMQASLELVSSGKYEEGQLAISLIGKYKKEFTRNTFEEIGEWFTNGVRNWAHVDGLCGEILSIFVIKGLISLDEIAVWEKSELKYKRRAVAVAMIKAVGNPYSAQQVIDTVEPLMTDREKVVQQGMGWLLREIWKKSPEPVEELLLKYRQTGPRIIFQYATEKMTPLQKERFRRGSKA